MTSSWSNVNALSFYAIKVFIVLDTNLAFIQNDYHYKTIIIITSRFDENWFKFIDFYVFASSYMKIYGNVDLFRNVK